MLKIYEELVSFAKVNKEFADELDPGGRFWDSPSQRQDQDEEEAAILSIANDYLFYEKDSKQYFATSEELLGFARAVLAKLGRQ